MELTKEEKKIIKTGSLFQEIPEPQVLEFLDQIGSFIRVYGKGEFLFYERACVDQIGIVLFGMAAIVKQYPDGSEHLFQKLYAGYLTGMEIACTATQLSPYSTCCLSDTKILFFSYKKLEQRASRDWISLQIQNRLLKLIASENIRKYYKINILSTRSLRERILLYLRIQQKKKGKAEFEIPFDRSQLANYLCVNRSALSKELAKMQADGLIRYQKNHFCILEERNSI